MCLVIGPRNAPRSREKYRSRHGPWCGHTPLDIVRYITIEHVLHCENITHAHSYLVLLLCHSYSIVFISNVFLLVHALFSLHTCSLSTIDNTTVNDIKPLSMYYIARTSYTFLRRIPCFITRAIPTQFFHFQCFFMTCFPALFRSYLGVVMWKRRVLKKEKKSDRVCSCSKKMAAKVV